jgi:hypothetical protein
MFTPDRFGVDFKDVDKKLKGAARPTTKGRVT